MVAADKRILVVDDEEIIRQSYGVVLADAGYTVRAVGSGREALQACRSERFDVMLADLRMPDMDGLEVARAVAKEFPELRVVIITGYPSRSTADQAARLGIAAYLEKPISPERLTAATADALVHSGPLPAADVEPPAPVAEPDTPETEVVAATTEPAVEPTGSPPTQSPWSGLALLALAPFVGLAYVLLMPLIGFGMLFFTLGSGVAEKLGWWPKA